MTPLPTDPRITAALHESLVRGEVGIQVAAYLHGVLIVEAAAGLADQGTKRPADASTLFNVFSVTKAVTATALHVQAARGMIDYRAPVTRYWPEYRVNGKESTTVRDVLSHRAGIPWMPEGVTPELQADWDWMTRQIEQMVPSYAPGTANVYHSLVWGWIVGELVRRTDPAKRDIATFIREEVLEPLAIRDLYLGLPDSERSRVATLIGGDPPGAASGFFLRGMPRQVFPSARVYNAELSRTSVNPAAGSIGTARSYARLFAMLAGHGELDGRRLLPADLTEKFTEPRDGAEAVDQYLGGVVPIGAYGYRVAGTGPAAHALLGASTRILHHPGAGGSIAWAELDTGLAVAICHNRMHEGPPVPTSVHPFEPIIKAIRTLASELAGRA
jgi:CubicO group peptidase (beta-lactamase class C family)